MRRQIVTGLAIATLLLAGVSLAGAQVVQEPRDVRPDRPYRGVFDGNQGRPQSNQSLKFRVSLFGAYDDNVFSDHGGVRPLLDPDVRANGVYGGISSTLEYQRTGRRIDISFGGGSSAQYYPDFRDFVGLSHAVNGAVVGRFGSTTISTAHLVQYAPFYTVQFLPAEREPIAAPDGQAMTSFLELAIKERPAFLLNSGFGIRHTLGARSSITGHYNVRRTAFRNEHESDLRTQSAGFQYRHQVTQYAALRAGYSIQQGRYGTEGAPATAEVQTFDLGVDYGRRLSFSRRTFVDFKIGSSAVEQFTGERVFRVIGDAGLTHEMGRTWKLRATYRRGAGLVEGLPEPVFADSVNASLTGFIAPRLDLLVQGAFIDGRMGLRGRRNPYDSLTASTRLRWALTSTLASFVEYLYYQYQFEQTHALSTTVPQSLNRHGVRVGVMFVAPFIQ